MALSGLLIPERLGFLRTITRLEQNRLRASMTSHLLYFCRQRFRHRIPGQATVRGPWMLLDKAPTPRQRAYTKLRGEGIAVALTFWLWADVFEKRSSC
jgi:hypothetical protein